MIEDLWYKNAVIYCLDVETFMDGNGDGVGDFLGLRRRLDYLAGLGVTCLWLLPFFGSPNRDNGYDVSDYYTVDPRLGDLGDFVAFSQQAKLHGIRLIIDLVVNHTSDQHPWFQKARRDERSPYRDYFLWSKEKPADWDEGMVFPGTQKATWTYDEEAKAYYFHRFYAFQPDLNISNPRVRGEILKIMGFWLELGVSGFRVDAVPFLIEQRGLPQKRREEDAFTFLSEMREFLSWRRGDAILLAEANVPMEDIGAYFDDGHRMQLVLHFLANQKLFLSLVDEDATPLVQLLETSPRFRPVAQWAQFLRNHDELDLGRLTDAERQRVFQKMGPEREMQLYGRGLRRRLATMLEGDAHWLNFAYSLLFTLPGTPVLWYGEEIGMGEHLGLEDRQSVRTPMQWSSDPNAGFSRAADTVKPLVEEGPTSYRRVNVASQRRDPDSLLNHVERLVRMRKECPELGWGEYSVLDTGARSVLGLRYDWKGNVMVVLHNFARAPRAVTLELKGARSATLVNVFSGEHVKPSRDGVYPLRLEAHGFGWFRLGGHDVGSAEGVERTR
ncbi:alpha-glucosidase C-terminal domain-containing protein [Archangium violaceum]|uniref:alpha-amylase family protein n=1 Tax=Archangium violaceum TaxID=83451 RepID=UPI00193AF75F|nr:alpha-amylase family protein [Archangium violaceum]QRK05935.1 alpha-glucosidase C-terminal domain-containing protein [Archangium violaceum]